MAFRAEIGLSGDLAVKRIKGKKGIPWYKNLFAKVIGFLRRLLSH